MNASLAMKQYGSVSKEAAVAGADSHHLILLLMKGGLEAIAQAKGALQQYSWPGNVRELDNVIQRALIMQTGASICEADLRIDPYGTGNVQAILHNVMPTFADSERQLTSMPVSPPVPMDSAEIGGGDIKSDGVLGDEMQQREFEIIIAALKREGGSRKNVAEQLGISPRTLRYKLAKMREQGIVVEKMISA